MKMQLNKSLLGTLMFANIVANTAFAKAPPPALPTLDVANDVAIVEETVEEQVSHVAEMSEAIILGFNLIKLIANSALLVNEFDLASKKNMDNTSTTSANNIHDLFKDESGSKLTFVDDDFSGLLSGEIESAEKNSNATKVWAGNTPCGSINKVICEERLLSNASAIAQQKLLDDSYLEKQNRLDLLAKKIAAGGSQQDMLQLDAAVALDRTGIKILDAETQVYRDMRVKKDLQNQQNVLRTLNK